MRPSTSRTKGALIGGCNMPCSTNVEVAFDFKLQHWERLNSNRSQWWQEERKYLRQDEQEQQKSRRHLTTENRISKEGFPAQSLLTPGRQLLRFPSLTSRASLVKNTSIHFKNCTQAHSGQAYSKKFRKLVDLSSFFLRTRAIRMIWLILGPF